MKSVFYVEGKIMKSREEFINELEESAKKAEEVRRAPKYACPKCGGGMCYDPDNFLGNIILACYPPIHQTAYKCDTCGYKDIISSR